MGRSDTCQMALASYDFGPQSCVGLAYNITANDEARPLFARGLAFMLGYNHEEAIGQFQACLAADPNCAMAWWGIAYGVSSNYNWPPGLGSGYDAIQQALTLRDKVSRFEVDMIEALAKRSSEATRDAADPAALSMGNTPELNAEFANAMQNVYMKYPTQLDVAAVYAESLMNLNPWALWTRDISTGVITATDENTMKAVEVIEKGFGLPGGSTHPALCHLYCHALELSPFPEKALPYADTLRTLMPDSGHLVHMPSHIDAWVGQWKEGMDCNIDACVADDKYVAQSGNDSMFYKFYRMHNMHFVIWCAMHIGKYEVAMQFARKMGSQLPAGDKDSGVQFMLAGVIPMGAIFLESYLAMPYHVMIRFGKWDDIIAEPMYRAEDAQIFPAAIATQHYARGLAYAAKGMLTQALAEQNCFLQALENPALAGRLQHNNTMYCKPEDGPSLLNVSRSMLAGEIEYRRAALQKASGEPRADFGPAYQLLRDTVQLSLELKYNEPWGQMMPVRHALGALLLEQGHAKEALEVYQEDVKLWKNNMWGLLGVKQCLEALNVTGPELDAATAAFDNAAQWADEKPSKTCFCAVMDAKQLAPAPASACCCTGKL